MNKNRATKSLSILLAMCMLLGMLPMTALADNFSDIKGHWAESQINEMINEGIVKGYPDGSFKPDGDISRAEFVSLIVKAFKLTKAKGKDFDDISNHWAKDAILTANAHGIVNGYSDTKFGPDDPITREQMAVIIVKVAHLTDNSKGKTFVDSQDISEWAKKAVAIASSNQLITGYPDNTFKPSANTSRAEATAVLSKSIILANLAAKVDYSLIEKSGKYGPETGDEIVKGDVVIKAKDTILQNLVIKGDLTIAKEVGDGDVTLNNIKVEGKTYIRGGGIDSIHINGGEYREIIIERTITGAARILTANVQRISITISENDNGEDVILNGEIKTVTIKADGIKVISQGKTTIDKIEVTRGLKDVKIELTEDTEVKEIILDSKVDVKGKGEIEKASGSKIRESTFVTAPKRIITPSTGGNGSSSSGGTSTTPNIKVSAISITTPPTKTIYEIGDPIDLTGLVVTATYSDNSSKTVTITSGMISGFNSNNAEVDQVVTVTYEGKTATFNVTIKEAAPVVDKTALTAALAEADSKMKADYTAASWTEFQTDLATAKAMSEGTQAEVDAKFAAVNAAIAKLVEEVPVVDTTPPVISGVSDKSVLKDSTVDVLAGVTAMDNVDGPVAVTANPSAIDTSKVGTTVVTYTATDAAGNTATATATFTVVETAVDVTGVTLDQTTMSLTVGGATGTLTATVAPAEATNKNVSWSSSNEGVATVSNGVVTPVSAGTTTITVTTDDGNKTATCDVTVTAATIPVTGVTLDQTTMNLTVGGATGTLTATVAPAEATNKNVSWSSSNEGVATVSNGVVTPVSAGTTTITVTTDDGNKTATCDVTVTAATIPVTGVTLDQTTMNLTAGGATGTLTATVTPENATNKNVSWSSSNEGVATVSNGVVTPVAAGSTTITVTTTDGGKTATCTVTVESAPDKVVTLKNIPGITIPAKDGVPVTAVGANDQYTGTVEWSPSVVDNKFGLGQIYTATITLTAKAGYTLEGIAEANFFSVIGADSTTYDSSSKTVTVKFPTTGDKPAQTGSPKISGSPVYGVGLMADSEGLEHVFGGVTYTWYRSEDANFDESTDTILDSTGTSGQNYTIVEADIGKYLIVKAVNPNSTGYGFRVVGPVVKANVVGDVEGSISAYYLSDGNALYIRGINPSQGKLEVAVAIDGTTYGDYQVIGTNITEKDITGLSGVDENTKVKIRKAATNTHNASEDKVIAGTSVKVRHKLTLEGEGLTVDKTPDVFGEHKTYADNQYLKLTVTPPTGNVIDSLKIGVEEKRDSLNGNNELWFHIIADTTITVTYTEIKTVNIAAIEGVTAPEVGATPVTSITETAQYTGTITWYPNQNPFVKDTEYTATITLTAKHSYSFDGVAANFFKVAGATSVTNAADSGVVKAVFPKTGAEQVTALTIYDSQVAKPQKGEEIKADPFTSYGGSYVEYDGTIKWYEEGNETEATGFFKGNTVYIAKVSLEARDGYTFAGLTENSFQYTGATSIIFEIDSSDPKKGLLTITFPATEDYPEIENFAFTATANLQESNANVAVGAVAGTFDEYVSGGTSPFTFSLVEGEGGADNGKFVIDGTDLKIIEKPLTEGTYSVRVQIKDTHDKTLTKILTFYVSAKEAVAPITDTPVSASPVTVGQTLADSTLSGTFKNADGDAVAGTLAWTDSTTVVNATGNFEWTFTPDDQVTYNVITGDVNVVVNPVPAVNPVVDEAVAATAVTVGQTLADSTLSGTFKNASNEAVAGTLAWTDSTTVVNATGDFQWTFTPDDQVTYNVITGDVNVVANPVPAVNPVVDEAVAATAVTVGQTLADSTLSGTFKNASNEAVAGTLAWTDSTTVVNATGDFQWTFTPTDQVTYNVITGDVNVVANPVPAVNPVVDEAVAATAVTVGQTLADSTLSGTFKNASNEAVAGTLAWTDDTTVVNATGDFGWTFTPDDQVAYNVITGNVEVTVNPPTIIYTDDKGAELDGLVVTVTHDKSTPGNVVTLTVDVKDLSTNQLLGIVVKDGSDNDISDTVDLAETPDKIGQEFTFTMPANDVTVAVTVGAPNKKLLINSDNNSNVVTLRNGIIESDGYGENLNDTLRWSYFNNTLTMNGFTGSYLANLQSETFIFDIQVKGENKITRNWNGGTLTLDGNTIIKGDGILEIINTGHPNTGQGGSGISLTGYCSLTLQDSVQVSVTSQKGGPNAVVHSPAGVIIKDSAKLIVKGAQDNSDYTITGVNGKITIEDSGSIDVLVENPGGKTVAINNFMPTVYPNVSDNVAAYKGEATLGIGEGTIDKPIVLTYYVKEDTTLVGNNIRVGSNSPNEGIWLNGFDEGDNIKGTNTSIGFSNGEATVYVKHDNKYFILTIKEGPSTP